MAQLELAGACVRYGDTVAVDGVSLSLDAGEIGCLVGPSGCGKTSVLRAIAGFEPVANGSIMLASHVASTPCWHVAPQRRSVGMLFQDFALFPHLTLAGNVAFGLRGWSRTGINERVEELADEMDATMAQVALAWLLHQEPVDSVIVGTSSVEHLEDAVEAIEHDLSESDLDYLEEPYEPVPVAGHR